MTKYYSVIAPTGGFGNHIRWLAMLDNKFTLPVQYSVWNQQHFDNIKGPDWPEFASFNAMPEYVKQECIEMGWVPTQDNQLTSVDRKVSFILDNIYNYSRTWHNWLYHEWQWRVILNDSIADSRQDAVRGNLVAFRHDSLDDIASIINTEYCLKVTIDPNVAYKHYVKLNNNLNNTPIETFIELINQENLLAAKYVHCVDATMMFNETLVKTIYDKICTTFELENNYSAASIIHKRWYDLHIKAEKEIVKHFTDLYT